eukprot:TRINITY_DN1684_c0_g1_i1.p1 TRINITY_DN1684_c0_g1~~TRINITY_DN1684_c0_g1_i1.p1  ORF type:complete len:1654 (-),score=167.49 TRINITY_DN1684_c0_g1_i1:41-5002(-)
MHHAFLNWTRHIIIIVTMKTSDMKEIAAGNKRTNKTTLNGLFVLFSSIASNNIISTAFYVIFLIIETFHFLYLPIQHAGENSDYAFSLFSSITSVVNYFRFVVSNGNDLIIMTLFVAHAAFMTLVIMAAVLVIYYGRKANIKRFKLVQLLSAFMSSSLVLIITALIIPMIESFIFPMLCVNGKRPIFDSKLMECGSSTQIGLSVVGSIYTFLSMVAFYTSNRVLIDDYCLSTLPWAGENQDIQMLHGIAKLILGIYLGADLEGKYSAYALLSLFTLQLIITWKRADIAAPYNSVVHTVKTLQEAIVLFVYAYMLLARLYTHSNTIWSLVSVIIMGFCAGLIIMWESAENRKKLLQKDWNQIRVQTEAENYVRTLCTLCFGGQGTAEWNFLCEYILHVHYQLCAEPGCICSRILESKEKLRNRSISNSEEEVNQSETESPNEFWLNLIEIIIEEQANKYQNSRIIMMQLSYFECLMLKNYFKSYYWLLKADLIRAGQTERFLAFRMKRILENWIIMKESKNAGSAHIIAILRFQKVCNAFQRILHHCTNMVISFWTLLEMPNLNAAELYSKGQKITTALRWVNDTFKKAVDFNPDYSYNYFYYGSFLKNVLNSEEEGREWIEKGEDIVKQQRDSWNKYNADICKSSDTAIVVISGDLDSLGMIQTTNEHVRHQLGFDVSDLVDRNISRIMPRIIGEVHDNFMLHHFKTGRGILIGNERMVFIQTKEGFMEPISILINTLPGLERGLQYIGFLRRDLTKIRNTYLKVPSQYKGYKLSYFLTDKDRFLIGISKNACGLFGLTTKYILRKKGLTTAPFPIWKLAETLGSDENEHKLEIGMEVELNVKSLLEYLDYDYLKGEEEKAVLKTAEIDSKRAFVMLMNFNYQDMVKLKAYMVIDLGYNNNEENNVNKSNNNEEQEEKLDQAAAGKDVDLVSSPSRSASSSVGGSSQNSIATMKKKASNKDRPRAVKNLIRLINVFIILILTSIVTEYILANIFKNKIDTCQTIVVLAYKRLTHFNISIYKVLAYLNIAHKLEPEIDNYVPNRTVDLVVETPQYLKHFMEDQYNFEENTMDSVSYSLRSEIIFKPLTISSLQEDFRQTSANQTLRDIMISIVTKGNKVMHRSKAELYSEHYLNLFRKNSPQDTLTLLDREIYYIFANSLSEAHPVISSTGLKVYDRCMNEIEYERTILYALHFTTYALGILFGVLLIPIMLRIQKNKRSLLMLFAEIPLGAVKTVVLHCRIFLKKNLSHLYKHSEDEVTEDIRLLSMKNASGKTPEPTELRARREETLSDPNHVKELLKGKKVTMHLQPKNENEEEKEEKEDAKLEFEEKDETQVELLAKVKQEKEEEFTKERKKAVQKVPVTLGYIALVVLIVFLVPIAYYSKMLLYIVNGYENIKENILVTLLMHQRWAFLSNSLLFYRTFLKSMTEFHYKINEMDPFDYYFDKSLKHEALIEQLKVYPKSDLGSLSELLKTYDSPELCSKIPYTAGSNYSWCRGVANGLTGEGLTQSVSYFLTRTRDKYVRINLATDPEAEKKKEMMNSEFIQLIMVFLRVYNPLFDETSDFLLKAFTGFLNTQIGYFTLDFVVIVLLVLTALLILTNYFAYKVEMEIFIARGIITLLPERILKSGSVMAILREGQQLSEQRCLLFLLFV